MPLNTPVYFGGLPSSFVPSTAPPINYYTGCFSDVFVDRTLVDFSSVTKEGTITEGCSQADGGVCQSGCDSCVEDLWNGSSCNDEEGGPVSLDGSGFLKLVPESIMNIQSLRVQFRTRQRNFALAQLNANTSIHVSNCWLIS